MNELIHDDFLLQNKAARILYHNYAEGMPIIDYHCHLDPKEIAENKQYRNITEVWLNGDHYKWRALRCNGVDERYITGDASDKEKFMKWAETMPGLIGNPLYHWTQLELKRYFGISELLGPETAEGIWSRCNEMLGKPEMSARGIIKKSNVKAICTTDDPIDSLEYHLQIKEDKTFDVKVLPTFRPDKAMNIEKDGFAAYLERLAKVSGTPIDSLEALYKALDARLSFFNDVGCRISDHSIETQFFIESDSQKADDVLKKVMSGNVITEHEANLYKSELMKYLGRRYAGLGWAMQLHIGAQRDNSTRMFKKLGQNTGFDMMADFNYSKMLAELMDSLDMEGLLPKTILYVMNPRDNEMIATLAGCFQGDCIPGKIQFGSGWWFNDQKAGMLAQMTALSSIGLLGRFVGMLTDSRSFLSYTRHEYFRRILCNLLGTWVENGEAPNDMELMGKMVQNISCINAENYFKL